MELARWLGTNPCEVCPQKMYDLYKENKHPDLKRLFPEGRKSCDGCRPIIHKDNWLLYDVYEVCCDHVITDDLGSLSLEFPVVDLVLQRMGVDQDELLDINREVREFAQMIYQYPREAEKQKQQIARNKSRG